MKSSDFHPCAQTLSVRAGIESDQQHGAVVPPLYLGVNFSFAGFGQKRKYDYSRSGNPTRDELASALAHIEEGAQAVVTNSGLSAVLLVLQLLAPGDLVVAPHDCYGGTYRLFNSLAQRGVVRVLFVDQGNDEAFAAALGQNPKLVWLETPSNPLLRITDVKGVVRRAQDVGAFVAVDNTFLSPLLQQPLVLGADFSVHSTTKYINGHSDVVGGAVVCKSQAHGEQLAWWANALGLTGPAFDSWLTLRGLRTLDARLRIHQENARILAHYLQERKEVEKVFYPGLPDHPGHSLAAAQQKGFGGMLSFVLKGGQPAVEVFVNGLSLFSLAESLGGVESLVAHPATMTHAAMDPEARRAAGLADGLLRLSVGIESCDDLKADLAAGFERVQKIL